MDGLIVENPLVDIGAGIYNLSIVDRYGCREIFSLELIDPELFSIQLMEDLDVTFGEEFIFQVETNYPISEYLWGPDDIFSCNNCDEPIALPKDDGFITLIATSEFGCVASDSLFVSVSREAAVFIPNIFSPNDDGINDVFSITGFRNSVDIIPSISVFDRWGNLVYQQQNIDTGNLALFWDGKINGKEVELGVYTYYFEIRYIDGIEESFTGSITLIR